jgi:hypothetical protein
MALSLTGVNVHRFRARVDAQLGHVSLTTAPSIQKQIMRDILAERMSITAAPISTRLVFAPTAASSGKGDASWRAK